MQKLRAGQSYRRRPGRHRQLRILQVPDEHPAESNQERCSAACLVSRPPRKGQL